MGERLVNEQFYLKSDELFLVGLPSSEDYGEETADGLYLRDTRHLSAFQIRLNGAELELLSAQSDSASAASTMLTNPVLAPEGEEIVLPHCIAVEERIALGADVTIDFLLENFARRALTLDLEIEFCADFRDLFAIRGFVRPRSGRVLRPIVEDRAVIFRYLGSDQRPALTRVEFNRDPTIAVLRRPSRQADALVAVIPGYDEVYWEPAEGDVPGAQAAFRVVLQPQQKWTLRVIITPQPADQSPVGFIPSELLQSLADRDNVETDNLDFNELLAQSNDDFRALLTRFPDGVLPAAGLPWFIAPFGRDSLIAGLQTCHLNPARAVATLRTVAALQGRGVDEWREEQPGKILHEMRYGELARTGQVPHQPYYGAVDSTPLFILLFAEAVNWTGDVALYRELLPNVQLALEWIDRYGDLDGDGFIEYQSTRSGAARPRHQVWKDSFDSLHHLDGRPVHGNISAVEVQGYVYGACRKLGQVAAVLGDEQLASDVARKAEMVRKNVEEAFWLDDEAFYAQALDGDKSPVRTVSSNPGHLLYCGLPSPERAAAMANRLSQPDIDSGWGIRTLSATAPTYNPMSYHNGSVWPHDNSLIAAGFYRYGNSHAAMGIVQALIAASHSDPDRRLPELYCGFGRSREAAKSPISYPTTCKPQAWSAGCYPLLLRSFLGMEADLASRTLTLAPDMPPWLNRVSFRELSVLGQKGSLTVVRSGPSYDIESSGLSVELLPSGALPDGRAHVKIG